jgi:hypothetical protein
MRVPLPVTAVLLAALLLQLLWHPAARRPDVALGPPPSLDALRLASLGEPVTLAKALMLYVQGVDDADGVHTPLRELDYVVLRDWLERVIDLDPRGQYPLLAASEVYAAVNDPARVRLMLDFVEQRFREDPERRWPYLAHAVIVARHRLHDLPLARRYAAEVRTLATTAPPWARELELFVLENMNELASARALAGAMLHSGQITDPRELAFLERKLNSLKTRSP